MLVDQPTLRSGKKACTLYMTAEEGEHLKDLLNDLLAFNEDVNNDDLTERDHHFIDTFIEYYSHG